MNNEKLIIGLFGFGVVGEGIYKVLLQTPSLRAEIKRICIKHPEKRREADPVLFTTEYSAILDDPAINLVVELIDDADEAFVIVGAAMKKGKAVVSANKKMIAEHLLALLELQKETGVSFLYEAACCGSIPIIRNLEEYYDNDLLQSICGIVNGSTNYILTKMIDEGLSYEKALDGAQSGGFAESNPSLDVEGVDAANKLSILLLHAYGIMSHPREHLYKGITQLHPTDMAYASEKGYRVKLTAQARKLKTGGIAAFVLPQFIRPESQLFSVKNEYNGVELESQLADKQFLYGKGAGRYPTSSAVLSDIAALRYQYRYEYKKWESAEKLKLTKNYFLRLYVSFDDWGQVDKGDFELIEEFHSTEKRQYLIGLISVEKLSAVSWLRDHRVSPVVLPEGIVENEFILQRSIKKMSLQLGGVY